MPPKFNCGPVTVIEVNSGTSRDWYFFIRLFGLEGDNS